MENTMSAATTLSTPQDQVDDLMRQVAEENGLEIIDKLADNPVVNNDITTGTLTNEEEERLSRRLVI